MSDGNRWSRKSEDVLIAYLVCFFQYIFDGPNRDQAESHLKKLRATMVIKTREKKFVTLSSPDTVVHLTSTYGATSSLESMALTKHQFHFIADDYYTVYRDELFNTPPKKYQFRVFLEELRLSGSLQVNTKEHRKFVDIRSMH